MKHDQGLACLSKVSAGRVSVVVYVNGLRSVPRDLVSKPLFGHECASSFPFVLLQARLLVANKPINGSVRVTTLHDQQPEQ